MKYFLYFFFPTFVFPILFWDNFQNSQYEYRSHLTSQTDMQSILTDTDSSFSSSSFPISANTKVWGERYVYQKGNNDCPLRGDGSCGFPYFHYYPCSCGGCGGCSTCHEIRVNYCECPLFYASYYNFIYLNQDIRTTSASSQFQITFEAKGSGNFQVFGLFRVNSCPLSIKMNTLAKGKYGLTPNSLLDETLTKDYKLYNFVYTHTDYGCSLVNKNDLTLAFNGADFTIKNLVASDPQQPVSEDFFIASMLYPLKFIQLYLDSSRLINKVSYQDFTPFNLLNVKDTFDSSIKTVIGSSKGSSSLITFLPITTIIGLGSNNILICGITGSHLIEGSSSTTFLIKSIQGTCTIDFTLERSNTIDLNQLTYYHNFSQIEKGFSENCNEDCVQLKLDNTNIVIKGVSISQVSSIAFLFSPYPCFTACPDCRLTEHCLWCGNCVPGLCDLNGCHECVSPYFVSQGKCVAKCPEGSYIDYDLRVCIQCNIEYCYECDQDFQCNICLNDTFLYQYKCLIQCPFRTYEAIDNSSRKICIDCKENCDVCNEMGCLVCQSGYLRYRNFEKNTVYKCVVESCKNNERYDSEGICQALTRETITVVEKVMDALSNKTKEENSFFSDALSYYLSDFDESKHFICQNDLSFYSMDQCSCYNKIQTINRGFLTIAAILMKIMKKNDVSLLCNDKNSIFNEECFYSTDNLENIFNNTLLYIDSLTVLTDFNEITYDFEEFWYLFNMIRGRYDYFVIIKILIGSQTKDLLLINWDLSFSSSDRNTLLSFKEYEKFIVSDVLQGCEDSEKKKYAIDFTYGKNDNYLIKSFEIFRRTDVIIDKINDMSNDNNCKQYILNREKCKNSTEQINNYYQKQLRRASSWILTWSSLSKEKKCALTDLFFELGDRELIQRKDIKTYLESFNFNNEFILNYSQRAQENMKVFTTNILPQQDQNYTCVERLGDIENLRNCSLKSVEILSKQIIEELMRENNILTSINSSNYNNLKNQSNLIYLENVAAQTFLNILTNNLDINFTILASLRTLPEQFLLYQWEKLCNNISNQMNINEAISMSGLFLEIDNYDEVKEIMEQNNFLSIESNPSHFVYSGQSLKEKNIKAFQRLWNCNYPEDSLEENGLFDDETKTILRKNEIKGFAQKCEGTI